MNYAKLIGFVLDTNQFTSPIIENASDAKYYIDKIIKIYGSEMLHYMYFADDCRFSSFIGNSQLSLYNFLTNK